MRLVMRVWSLLAYSRTARNHCVSILLSRLEQPACQDAAQSGYAERTTLATVVACSGRQHAMDGRTPVGRRSRAYADPPSRAAPLRLRERHQLAPKADLREARREQPGPGDGLGT